MTVAGRPDGPFHYYADLYGGGSNVTAASIRALVDDPATDAATIHRLAEDLDRDATVTASLVEGQVRNAVAHAPAVTAARARTLSTNATYAVGLINLLATHVHNFDGVVADLNHRYQQSMHASRVLAGTAQPTADDLLTAPALSMGYVPGAPFDAHAVGAATKASLNGEYRRAHRALDDGADDIATKFGQGATHANLRALVDAGAIPLTVAGHWPWLHLTDDEKRKALLALLASGAIPDLASMPGGSVQSWLKKHPEIANYLPLFDPVGLPDSGDPVVVAAWWRKLGPLGQLAAATLDPEVVGNLDGVQGWGRDLANRTQLDGWLQQIANGEVPPGMTDDAVASLKAIQDVLSQPGPRQLLGLDPYSGERTHAIVAIGNVDTADNIGVFTPGLKTNVPDKLGSYDADMMNLYQQSNAMLAQHGINGTVATVSYLGYDAPQVDSSLLDLGAFGGQADSVTSSDLARQGGDSLAAFYQGINASRGDDVHLTALGHSYGSTTTGYALQHDGVGVDDAVLFGSPGPGTDHRSDLHADNVYLIENDDDIVADLGQFGGDPSFIDGITHLESHTADLDGAEYQGSTGHGSYLDNGTTAQHNMAAVLTGIDEEQIRGKDIDHGDLLMAPNPSDLGDALGATGGEVKDGLQHWGENLVHSLSTLGRPPGY